MSVDFVICTLMVKRKTLDVLNRMLYATIYIKYL